MRIVEVAHEYAQEHEHPVARQPVGLGGRASRRGLFLIIVFSVAGLVSYLNLGRAEDPSFAIKTMVITAVWPGAIAEGIKIRSPTSSKKGCRNWSSSTSSGLTRGPASASFRCS